MKEEFSRLLNRDAEFDLTLPCDCKCVECKRTFLQLFEAKALIAELELSLKSEQQATEKSILDVAEMEKKNDKQIKSLTADKIRLAEKHEKMFLTLESERKLRLDEAYKNEKATEEANRINEEIIAIKDDFAKLMKQLEVTKEENRRYAEMVIAEERVRRKTDETLRDYEGQILHLETTNADLRTRLCNFETQHSSFSRSSTGLGFSSSSSFDPQYFPTEDIRSHNSHSSHAREYTQRIQKQRNFPMIVNPKKSVDENAKIVEVARKAKYRKGWGTFS